MYVGLLWEQPDRDLVLTSFFLGGDPGRDAPAMFLSCGGEPNAGVARSALWGPRIYLQTASRLPTNFKCSKFNIIIDSIETPWLYIMPWE